MASGARVRMFAGYGAGAVSCPVLLALTVTPRVAVRMSAIKAANMSLVRSAGGNRTRPQAGVVSEDVVEISAVLAV